MNAFAAEDQRPDTQMAKPAVGVVNFWSAFQRVQNFVFILFVPFY